MGKLEEILTGRSFDDILQDPTGQVIASRDGGERLVIPLTARLQDALASIDDGTVDEVAAQWAAPDAYYGTGADAELAAGALRDLVHLARAGRERGETLLLGLCLTAVSSVPVRSLPDTVRDSRHGSDLWPPTVTR
jgi:hypothetical protein